MLVYIFDTFDTSFPCCVQNAHKIFFVRLELACLIGGKKKEGN